jgi:hypothetical protein
VNTHSYRGLDGWAFGFNHAANWLHPGLAMGALDFGQTRREGRTTQMEGVDKIDIKRSMWWS